MLKKLLFIIIFFIYNSIQSQIVINEIDADTPSTDILEFVEIKSTTPNFSLNGYVLVFFNGLTTGTGLQSYLAIDLDGYTTDLNGIFLIGNTAVTPAPQGVFMNNLIQNGPDGVAIYQANATNFPTNTNATTTNLIQGITYSNSSTQAAALNSVFGFASSINENQTLNAATVSIQRKNDGSYETKTPTPGANNDGSGVVLNGISTSVTPTGNLTEGNNFSITFTTQQNVADSPLVFTFSIANANFNTFDYSGNLSVIMPVGTHTITKNLSLVDDDITEGDETLLIVFNALPSGYVALANNIAIRVHDNDNIVRNFGNPLAPTYGNVNSTAPLNYYSSLEGLTGNALKNAIQNIIANSTIVREHTYGDVFEVLKDADENPANSSQVWLMYVEEPRSKLDFQTGSSGALGFWNREHIFPQSRGGFTDGTSSTADGFATYVLSNANKIESGHSDMHHIRAEDSPENSIRSNRNYGVDYNGTTVSTNSWKGDVARALFYMAVRYNGLNVVNGNVAESPTGNIGDLATLLNWNTLDPADDFEMNRNNIIYTWQINRNPFIDYPNLANFIWGNAVGQPWSVTLKRKSNENFALNLYPNPAVNKFQISGIENNSKIEVHSVSGSLVFAKPIQNLEIIETNLASGLYFVSIFENNFVTKRKLIIQ